MHRKDKREKKHVYEYHIKQAHRNRLGIRDVSSFKPGFKPFKSYLSLRQENSDF